MVAIALSAGISTADRDGLQALLAVMKAGRGVMVVLLVLLLPAVIPALLSSRWGRCTPFRSARNAAAFRQGRKILPGREAYKVSYLAMCPQTREGLARAALDHVVPAGVPLYTEARSHSQAIYASGLHRLTAADGTPTVAMGTR